MLQHTCVQLKNAEWLHSHAADTPGQTTLLHSYLTVCASFLMHQCRCCLEEKCLGRFLSPCTVQTTVTEPEDVSRVVDDHKVKEKTASSVCPGCFSSDWSFFSSRSKSRVKGTAVNVGHCTSFIPCMPLADRDLRGHGKVAVAVSRQSRVIKQSFRGCSEL